MLAWFLPIWLSSGLSINQCANVPDPQQRLDCYDQQSKPLESPPANTREETIPYGFRLHNGDGFSLHVQCRGLLTYLWLELPEPVTDTPQLLLDGIPTKAHWFIQHSGQRLESGRGLPAINRLKQWQQHHTLTLIGQPPLSLHPLATALIPIRRRCHW